MAANHRRLACDHASLHNSGLPPNYLFPPSSSAFPDDLAQLTILLSGPQWTPYSQGLWKLHLRMPEDYPQSPPKASFRTRIWHPNVEESTGAVCVDTLKRDWEPTLTLRAVLITISCLLIHPNPDSALNSAAGALLQDDYEAFARQARLMTSIHAPIPSHLKGVVMEAKRRGEDPGTETKAKRDEQREDSTRLFASSTSAKRSATSSVIMKKKPLPQDATNGMEKLAIQTKVPPSQHGEHLSVPLAKQAQSQHQPSPSEAFSTTEETDLEENPATASKENDPSLSPSPVINPPPPTSPRKNHNSILGKRPLSVLSAPSEPEMVLVHAHDDDDDDDDRFDGLSASERNIIANMPQRDNIPQQHNQKRKQQPDNNDMKEPVAIHSMPPHKSPKLSDGTTCANTTVMTLHSKGLDKAAPSCGDLPLSVQPDTGNEDNNNNDNNHDTNEKQPHMTNIPTTLSTENFSITSAPGPSGPSVPKSAPSSLPTSGVSIAPRQGAAPSKQKSKPRIGLRRL